MIAPAPASVLVRAAVAAALLLTAGSASGEARPMAMHEAIELALRQNLEVRAADSAEVAQHEATKAARGEFGPKLKLDVSVLAWDRPFTVFAPALGGSVTIHDRQTSNLSVTATQPLSALYPLAEQYRAESALDQAAHFDGAGARAELVYRTTEAYLRLLQAIDLRKIGEDAVKDIAEQEKTARALVDAGTLISSDLLRTQVALAQAKQDLLRAEAQVGSVRAGLASLIGLPVATEIEPERVDGAKLPALPPAVEAVLPQAERRRPEVQAANARAQAADHSGKAALASLLPQIAVGAGYQHAQGFLELFTEKDAGYFGVFISWDFWEWGAKYYKARGQRERAHLSGIQLEQRRRDVALQVTQRLLDARAAWSAIDVAHEAVAQGREAYRVTKALYENGSATTTDLLDAQLALERASANDARTLYDALVAYAALSRAAGGLD
jgi:outer membrane protein